MINIDLGKVLKTDECPEKYCKQSGLLKDTVPIIAALLIVGVFSGSLFVSAGMDVIVTVAVEVIIVVGLYFLFYAMFNGAKRRMSETYINVCEYGICGVKAANGLKNEQFSFKYSEITGVEARGERLFVYSVHGKSVLVLNDAGGTAEMICAVSGMSRTTRTR